jgi:CheY-like chemotaxis protein
MIPAPTVLTESGSESSAPEARAARGSRRCGQESDRRKSREAGFDEHLTKPVDAEVLLQLIAKLARNVA